MIRTVPVERTNLCDENGGAGQVALSPFLSRRYDEPELPALLSIEQGAHQRRRIESWDAQKPDRAVACHQGARGSVPDQAVLLNRQVPLHLMERTPVTHH